MTLLKRYAAAPPASASASTSQLAPKPSSVSAGDELDNLLANVSFDTQTQPKRQVASPRSVAGSSSSSDDSLDSLLKGLSDELAAAPLAGYTQPRRAPAVPDAPAATHAHAPDPNPPARELQIAPGRGKGGLPVLHRQQVETNEHTDAIKRQWNKSNLPPSPGFNPVQGDVVKYHYIGRDQLEADLIFLKSLMAAGEIDNTTFQQQRDHMLIEARGGPAYGAQFSGSHPNFSSGRAKGTCWFLSIRYLCIFIWMTHL
jgi:hypothetical protein